MSAYVLVEIDMTGAASPDEYRTLAEASVTAHGGAYLVRGGATEVLEGTYEPKRIVVLEFPDADVARRWWSSPEYRQARTAREGATATFLLVEGVRP